jgi:hypothetical protein
MAAAHGKGCACVGGAGSAHVHTTLERYMGQCRRMLPGSRISCTMQHSRGSRHTSSFQGALQCLRHDSREARAAHQRSVHPPQPNWCTASSSGWTGGELQRLTVGRLAACAKAPV